LNNTLRNLETKKENSLMKEDLIVTIKKAIECIAFNMANLIAIGPWHHKLRLRDFH
jgi:hypothetical protein